MQQLPPGSMILQEVNVQRTLSHGKVVQVGSLIIYEHGGKIKVTGKPDPPTPENLQRIQTIIRRKQRLYDRNS